MRCEPIALYLLSIIIRICANEPCVAKDASESLCPNPKSQNSSVTEIYICYQ